MGTAKCRTMAEIGEAQGKNKKTGAFEGYCSCGMMIASFDNGMCPACGKVGLHKKMLAKVRVITRKNFF